MLNGLLGPNGLKDIPTQEDLDEIKKKYDEISVNYAEKVVELEKQLTLNSEKSDLDTQKKEFEENGIKVDEDLTTDPEKIKALVAKGENYINGNFLKAI